MAEVPASGDRRVERDICMVGGVLLLLLGVQSISGTALNVYDRSASGGSLPGPSSAFWVDSTVALFVGLLFLLGGAGPLYLGWGTPRARPKGWSKST